MTTDRAELEKAIAELSKVSKPDRWYFTTADIEHIRVALKAARAHLETLPRTKMVWAIDGDGRNRAPYTRHCEAEDRGTLNSYIECLHADGFTVVTIRHREVPA